MSEADISPEDREILAKTKFKQWFDECFTESFGTAFDSRVTETHEAAGTKPPETKEVTTQSGNKKKRRSLFDMAVSDTFGW